MISVLPKHIDLLKIPLAVLVSIDIAVIVIDAIVNLAIDWRQFQPIILFLPYFLQPHLALFVEVGF